MSSWVSRSEKLPGLQQPLVPVTLAWAGGIVFDKNLWPSPPPPWFWGVYLVFAATMLGAWWCFARRQQWRGGMVCLICGLAALGALRHHGHWWILPADDLARFARDQAQPICGEFVVQTVPEKSIPPTDAMIFPPPQPYVRCVAEALALRDGLTWRSASGKVLLLIAGTEANFLPGDRIRVLGKLKRFSPLQNPGQFDMREYRRADRLLSQVYVEYPEAVTMQRLGASWSPKRLLGGYRQTAAKTLEQLLPEGDAPLAKALLLGFRDEVPEAFEDVLLKSGTIHLLAISGLHVGLLVGAFAGIFRRLAVPRRLNSLLILLLIISYASITGARPSTIRAAVMLGLVYIAQVIARPTFPLNTLALAALIVLVVNPADLFRVGPQLSFLAASTLIVAGSLWQPRPRDQRRQVAQDPESSDQPYAEDGVYPQDQFHFQTHSQEPSELSGHDLRKPDLGGKVSLQAQLEPGQASLSAQTRSGMQNVPARETITRETADPGSDPAGMLGPSDSHPAKRNTHGWFQTKVLGSLSLSLVVWLVSQPLVLARFHIVNPLGCILTPILVIPVTVALVTGFVLIVLGPVFGAWLAPVALACHLALWLVQQIVTLSVEHLPLYWWLPNPPEGWVIAFYGLWLGYLGLGWHGAAWLARLFLRGLVALGCLGLLIVLLPRIPPGEFRLTLLSVGHGLATVLEMPNGEVWVYDVGSFGGGSWPARIVANYLWSRGHRQIDLLILSHADFDHFSGVPQLLDYFPVKKLATSPAMWQAAGATGQGAPTTLRPADRQTPLPVTSAGEQVLAGPEPALQELATVVAERRLREITLTAGDQSDLAGCRIKTLHPPPGFIARDDNANSLVLLVEYVGRTVLLTGDLDGQGTQTLLTRKYALGKIDVLIAPHHGSVRGQPTDLARTCRPDWLLVSGGQQSVQAIAERYENAPFRVLHTGEVGAISVRFGKGSCTVEPFRPAGGGSSTMLPKQANDVFEGPRSLVAAYRLVENLNRCRRTQGTASLHRLESVPFANPEEALLDKPAVAPRGKARCQG